MNAAEAARRAGEVLAQAEKRAEDDAAASGALVVVANGWIGLAIAMAEHPCTEKNVEARS
ncbi:hypothetical protein [Actinoallomurus sp. NPDC052274]|uniref:hypothetical protein n=1 Tax=Actinoallomurus sp. NPDC052274 TaxID=3155420 RepID=UPI0034472E47